jgi:DNA-directed RNA polymerase
VEKSKKGPTDWKAGVIQRAVKGVKAKRDVNQMIKKVKKLLGDEEWTTAAHVKIGSTLLNFLIKSAVMDGPTPKPVFEHTYLQEEKTMKLNGIIKLEKDIYESLVIMDKQQEEAVLPRYLPMLVPPRPWDNKNRKSSCYMRLKCKLIRSYSQGQQVAVAQANMDRLLESINYVASVPWKVNLPMLEVIEACWAQGLTFGEMPPKLDFPMPSQQEAIRLPVRPFNPGAPNRTSQVKGHMTAATEQYWQARHDKIMQAHPADDPYWQKAVFDAKYYQELCKHVSKKNSEMHSLRCDMSLKLSITRKFMNETFYFPYSLDFRGRAYPVPPNLNHLGSDMCRGLLLFAKPRALGPKGLDWLKIHLANVCGNNKISQKDRIAWADSMMDKVRASATDPLREGDENCRWWMTGEEPFQILAVCKEIVNAIDSGDPESYMCALPVHQDGSCNGLQHYAALGRDKAGGSAVNLCPSNKPQDVYSQVLEIVNRKINEDAKIDENHPDLVARAKGAMARNLVGVVNRKVIKQSVMTSVYGVTRRGASLQVHARLQETFLVDGNELNMERERELLPWAV